MHDRFYSCRQHPEIGAGREKCKSLAKSGGENPPPPPSSSFFFRPRSPPRSLARSDPLGPRGARVNDRSLGQPQAVASESHTRCIRHVPRAGEQRDPPD